MPLQLDGSSGKENVGNPSDLQLTGGQITLVAGFQGASPGSGYRDLISKNGNYALGLYNGVPYVYDWATSTRFSAASSVADGAHHTIKAVIDQGVTDGSQIYIDGSPSGSAFTVGNNVSTADNLTIGALSDNHGNAENLGGIVDNIKIWSSLDTSGTPLLWHKLDETSGTTAADSGTGGNDGTLSTSGATWTGSSPPPPPPPPPVGSVYMSPSGSDANDGSSSSTPIQTSDRANEIGTGSLFIECGWVGGPLVWAGDITNYGTGNRPKIVAPDGSSGIVGIGSRRNLQLKASGVSSKGETTVTPNTYLIEMIDTRTSGDRISGIVIDNCEFDGAWGLIRIGTPAGTQTPVGFTDPHITNCFGYNGLVFGLDARGGNGLALDWAGFPSGYDAFLGITISNNRFTNIVGDPNGLCGAPIQVGNATGGGGTGNIVRDSGQVGGMNSPPPGGPGGIVLFQCNGVIFDEAEVTGMQTAIGVDGVGIDIDVGCINCKFTNWKTENNAGSAALHGGISGNEFIGGRSVNDALTVNVGQPLRNFGSGSAEWDSNTVEQFITNAQPS